MTDHHEEKTLMLWASDEIRIIFLHPDADREGEMWKGTSKDLCQQLTGKTFPGLGIMKSRPDHILIFDEKDRIYQPVPIPGYERA